MQYSIAGTWFIEIPGNNEDDEKEDRHRQMHATANRSADWSELGGDVLGLILCLLGPLDHLRFGCVCRSWRRARLQALHNSPADMHAHILQAACQAPMLLFSDRRSENKFSRHRQFLNPLDGRRYIFNLASLFSHLCVGSFGGWLVMVARPSQPFLFNLFNPKQELYLYNPFNATKFRLPYDCEINFEESQIAVSSSEPSSSLWQQGLHSVAVLIVDQYSRKLYWIRGANANRWSSCQCGEDMHDDIFVQLVAAGCSKFYALTWHGRLAFIDLDSDHVLVWGADSTIVHFDRRREDVYLVEFDGELLAVIVGCPRGSSLRHLSRTSLTMRVLRLDSTSCEWIEAKDRVKDKVLFLGKRGSICKDATMGGGRGKVYTAGGDSSLFGVFDMQTCKGSVVRSDNPGSSQRWGVWVLQEFIRGDRETSLWVVPLRTMAMFLATILLYVVGGGAAISCFITAIC